MSFLQTMMKSRLSGSVVNQLLLGSRPYSTAIVRTAANQPTQGRLLTLQGRSLSTGAAVPAEDEKVVAGSPASGRPNENKVVSYWGIAPSKLAKEDGTEWKWNSFRVLSLSFSLSLSKDSCFDDVNVVMDGRDGSQYAYPYTQATEQMMMMMMAFPWEAYTPDLSIDLKKHHVPITFLDKVAYWTRRYGCRAMMLETVAAVPGMVGGMLLHCKSLRHFEHSGGWIKALLEEAENERMHLMTFMEVAKPRWYERALVFTVQGVFFNAYFLAYLVSPKLAHRVVGYLEEEAIHSYTEFLKELDKGNIENVPAPAIAIDYWRMPPNSTLRDVVMVVRADEAHHRDVNHFASDIHYQGHELRDSPAPLNYH
ncbi:ubiquinol oxidase 2, mitochondrial-like protein [Cinnamomum micranthum f. kanehirae]|uniref:Ubiquinol oxidase n=1 Tax=Cinnamomum micranthum f. kanehirae TaxID=337451 RepID=A0A443P7S7_9MAGN|nr:ubiquinol oxidase 2, mitochondrial-like protein [Cinnamomum micranthum f. kanehirae]